MRSNPGGEVQKQKPKLARVPKLDSVPKNYIQDGSWSVRDRRYILLIDFFCTLQSNIGFFHPLRGISYKFHWRQPALFFLLGHSHNLFV